MDAGPPSSACARLSHMVNSYHFDPERTIMIGDRLDTDIAFGKNGGVSTLLVLTGVTSEASLAASTTGVVPDYILGSVGDLQILC